MADVRERAARPAGDGDGRWVLHAADRALIGNKACATRLGFAVLLKLFAAESRFPRCAEDVPFAAVEAVAGQVGVGSARLSALLVGTSAGGASGACPRVR